MPQNSQKYAKYREIHVCTAFFKLISAIGAYLLAVNLQIYLETIVTETCKQRPKTTTHRLCCEKLGISHDVKGFAIGSFPECIVVERAK